MINPCFENTFVARLDAYKNRPLLFGSIVLNVVVALLKVINKTMNEYNFVVIN